MYTEKGQVHACMHTLAHWKWTQQPSTRMLVGEVTESPDSTVVLVDPHTLPNQFVQCERGGAVVGGVPHVDGSHPHYPFTLHTCQPPCSSTWHEVPCNPVVVRWGWERLQSRMKWQRVTGLSSEPNDYGKSSVFGWQWSTAVHTWYVYIVHIVHMFIHSSIIDTLNLLRELMLMYSMHV